MRQTIIRCGLLAGGFALALVARRPISAAHGVAPERTSAPAVAMPLAITPETTFASDGDPRVLELREQRASAHAADVARRAVVERALLADPITRPLGELMGKHMDVPRAELDGSPEDIAAFKALFADPEAGVAFATRALELLPRQGFGFERSAVLAGLASLSERGAESRVVPVMMDELAHTVIDAPDPDALNPGTLDLGLPQIAQRAVLNAPSVTDSTAVDATARAMLANGHPTVTMALARQLAALRPQAKAALVAALERDGYPVDSILWTEGGVP